MAKSKSPKVFHLQDGRSVIFAQEEFERAVNESAKEINHKNRKKQGGKATVFKMIADRLSPSNDPDIIENTVRVVKNWYYGNNGPSNIEDVYTLAEVLGYENKEAFLREKKAIQEEKKMITSTSDLISINNAQRRGIEAMKQMKEKEVAFELYSAFVDLIGQYIKADWEVWFEHKEGTPEWQAALANFPRRMPVECAIHKAKMYLPEETICKAYNLLETMFGLRHLEFDEPCELKYDVNYLLSGFLAERLELFDRYLENHGIGRDEEGFGREDMVWYDFMYDLNGDWWRRLDEVFEDYLP